MRQAIDLEEINEKKYKSPYIMKGLESSAEKQNSVKITVTKKQKNCIANKNENLHPV